MTSIPTALLSLPRAPQHRAGRCMLLVGALLASPSCQDVPAGDPGRDPLGARGAVTAGHPIAAFAGLEVLQQGGNAMDAAIAMAGVLAVARPHMNGLGGDMFLLYYEAATGTVHALNASGTAGSGATNELRGPDGEPLAALPEVGPLTVTVPGAVRGWAAALARFGTISWRQALEPAVAVAQVGLPVSQRLALDLEAQREKIEADRELARIYAPSGAIPAPGSTLRQADLLTTLEQVQHEGPDEFYSGATARRIVEHLSSMGGLLTVDDFAAYEPVWMAPIDLDYRGVTVTAFPPNTQGVALLEELAILQHFDVAALGHNTPDYLHTVTEAIRLAVADRDTTVADPRAMRVAVEDLLAPERIAELAASIAPDGRAHGTALAATDDHPNTVYLIAADEDGNVVSLIQSLFHSFGSGIAVPGTGVILHNRGALFTLDPSHPNVLAPGNRPYHTLCPVLVLKDGRPWLAMGTPGGDGQTHTLTQILNNVLVFGMTPQQAIDAPRIRRHPDGSLAIEDRIAEEVRSALAARGYEVLAREGWTAEFGGAQAILFDGGLLRAGADRRREAWAMAY